MSATPPTDPLDTDDPRTTRPAEPSTNEVHGSDSAATRAHPSASPRSGRPPIRSPPAPHPSASPRSGRPPTRWQPAPDLSIPNRLTVNAHATASFDAVADIVLELRAPDAIPGYELIELLGEGGMGEVWKARQLKLNRLVALKMILGGRRAGPKDLIRFLAEAEAVAAIRHPHVVQVYEYGEAEGRPFLAMEYLPGGSLTERLNATTGSTPMPPPICRPLAGPPCRPRTTRGSSTATSSPPTSSSTPTASPRSPTSAWPSAPKGTDLTADPGHHGHPRLHGPRAGPRRHQVRRAPGRRLCSGRDPVRVLDRPRPFDDDSQMALLRKVMDDPPERPQQARPRLPRDLELICLKCLEKDPAERYPTAAALADDLGRFLAGEPVSVRPAGLAERRRSGRGASPRWPLRTCSGS